MAYDAGILGSRAWLVHISHAWEEYIRLKTMKEGKKQINLGKQLLRSMADKNLERSNRVGKAMKSYM